MNSMKFFLIEFINFHPQVSLSEALYSLEVSSTLIETSS